MCKNNLAIRFLMIIIILTKLSAVAANYICLALMLKPTGFVLVGQEK